MINSNFSQIKVLTDGLGVLARFHNIPKNRTQAKIISIVSLNIMKAAIKLEKQRHSRVR